MARIQEVVLKFHTLDVLPTTENKQPCQYIKEMFDSRKQRALDKSR